MTRHLDPDRRLPAPRFWPFPIDIDTSVCSRCSAMVPATPKAQQGHTDHHWEIDGLATMAATINVTSKLSGLGLSAPAGVAGDDTLGGDLKSPPTPEQEEPPAAATRSGAEGSNQDIQRGAELLPGVTPGPAAVPPAAGPGAGSRPGLSRREDPGRLPLTEPPDYSRLTR